MGVYVCGRRIVSKCEHVGVDEVRSTKMVGCMCEREVKRWVRTRAVKRC